MEIKVKQHNWPKYLSRYIDQHFDAPFKWGVLDCATFAVGAMEAMVGGDVGAPDFKYKDQKSALRFNKKHSVIQGMITNLGAYVVTKGYETTGDIVVVQHDGFECCHVISGKRCYGPAIDDKVRALSKAVVLAQPGVTIMRFD